MSILPDTEEAGYSRRFALAWLIFSVLFLILAGRFFYLQIVRGDEYRERARVSFTLKERIPARRGRILDKRGVELAHNVPRFELVLTPQSLDDPATRSEVLGRLSALLEMTQGEVDELSAELDTRLEANEGWLPITVKDSLVGTTCPFDGAELQLRSGHHGESAKRQRRSKAAESARAHGDDLFCNMCGLNHEAISEKATYCPHDRARLTWGSAQRHHATCSRCARSFVTVPICPNDGNLLAVVDHNLSCPICERSFSNEVAVIKAHQHELPGVDIRTDFTREFPYRYVISHLLGYVNLVTREDREQSPGVYPLSARIGRAGIERALEPELRGEAGEAEYFKGAGKDLMRGFEAARAGHDVWLTIDLKLQKEVRQALRYNRSGAAVVVDPRSGDILAMYSTPGFDPNIWSGRLSTERFEAIKKNPYYPLVNKAVTPYAPGSVYKIVTSLAALNEGIVDAETTIHCPGQYEFGGRTFRCHNRTGHGPMQLVTALKYSCDVYFYQVGERASMDVLARYGHMFGFGEPTGIEVAERVGRVPTKAYHADTPLGFQPGFTLSTAIGQGSLTSSPLQVARAFAALANGGRVLETRVVRQLTDEKGDVLQRFLPVEIGRLEGRPEHLALIREGLVRVVNDQDGTAPDVALDAIVVAGKTGTAEAAQTRPNATDDIERWLLEDHAWFAAYAPADDPQVVVVVFLEHGGSGGKHAGPLAKRIIQSWMRLGLYRTPAPSEPVPSSATEARP